MVFKHAKDILRYKGTNPITELKGNILFKGLYKTSQFKSVDIDEVGKYWSEIKNIKDFQDRVFLMINVVTALRVGRQIKLKWIMFDRFKKEITIPKELMKNRESFITPLPEFLVSLLSKLKEINKPETDDEYIFKGRDKGSHYQNNRPRLLLIKKLGFNVTAHGNRTLFKDINEIEGRSTISIELQLSHSRGSKNSVENAYIKSKNYIDYRRNLVEDYLKYLENKADVIF